ncbi:hypothetical protein K503DRAFT_819234 [Rhizopogon vinicolor AM-OR11-026]|uniref:Uncharacterized protein n=1 Tax=Rhizopogon vinicolor AM-OR11-026 TaxID=1314800 RepID=A0A1B7MZJ9_9AGAM|nr:hypothetical protein K503DRAFT_819234 [Rhizopogon vinicolor AM-OR11-026]
MHKTDLNFEGGTIVIQQVVEADLQGVLLNYLTSRDRFSPFYSTFWVWDDGSTTSRSWFISSPHQFFPDSISGHSFRAGGATSLVKWLIPHLCSQESCIPPCSNV